MPKITKRFAAEAAAPAVQQKIYRDTLLPGFGLRVTRAGSKSYVLEVRVNGLFRRITLGDCRTLTPAEARKLAKEILSTIVLGSDPVALRAKPKTKSIKLNQVLEDYLAVRKLRPNSSRLYRSVIRHRLHDWLSLPITEISREMIERRHREISTLNGQLKASKSQANMTMCVLKLLLNFAAQRYQLDGKPVLLVNPVNTLSHNRSWHRIPARQGIIPDHKFKDWFGAVNSLASSTVRDFLLLALFTGLRHREASTLRFDDIDFDARTLTIRSEIAKNHKEHRLPLSSFVFALLKRRRELITTSPFVFPGRHGPIVHICHSLEQAQRNSGVHFTVHDCRRTFLTVAERLGIPFVVLKKLANHSGGNDTTLRYIIVDVERLREPVELISEKLLSLMGCSNYF